MNNNENIKFEDSSQLRDSNGTGVLSTMIFMAVSVIIMIALKYIIA